MEQATVSSQSDAEATVVYDDVCDKVMGTNSEVGLEVLVYMAVLQLKHRQGLKVLTAPRDVLLQPLHHWHLELLQKQ